MTWLRHDDYCGGGELMSVGLSYRSYRLGMVVESWGLRLMLIWGHVILRWRPVA